MKRVIYVEPTIKNGDIISSFFYEYNPDSSFINPHVCLVFPFESNLNTKTINELFNKILKKYNSFNIKLQGISISHERKNNFLFLNVNDTDNTLNKLSKEFYNSLSNNATLKGKYFPHVTIGKSKSLQKFQIMYNKTANLLNDAFDAKVSSVYSKIIIEDISGNTYLKNEIEYKLPQNNNKNFNLQPSK